MRTSMITLKKEILLTVKITLFFTVLFFVINGHYTVYSFIITFGISSLYSVILGLGLGYISNYLTSKWDWIRQTTIRIWAGVFSTVLYVVPAILIIDYIIFIKIQGRDFNDFFRNPMLMNHFVWSFVSFGVSAFLHARSFMIEWKKAVRQESTAQKIVAKTESAKFETLKNQIDPHFLFNSLNVLTSLIGENPYQAERFTTKLSKIYRYVLEQRNKELVPIGEELQFAKTYMELLQMRFEDALEFELPSELSDSKLKLVPLSLQLLLENAVKHNVVSSSRPLKISIYEDQGVLNVKNTINPKETIGGKSTKVGLQNIVDRYGLISDKAVYIKNDKKTFTVSLPLLLKTKTIMKTTENFENSSYIRAIERVEKIKEFYQNLITYLIFIPIFITINLRFSPQFHWFYFPIIGWGIGVLFNGLDVYNYSMFLGKNWEERKIRELMDKDNLK